MVELDRATGIARPLGAGIPVNSAEQDGVPQWKPWFRWPFLALALTGAAMVGIGVRECASLWTAIRDGAPDIVVETAMSAFPPLGIGFIALGSLAFFPRMPDGTGIRPIRMRGKDLHPGKIVVAILLVGLLLYPVCGIALRAVTTRVLTDRGYVVQTFEVSHTSGYGTVHWRRTR